MVGHTHEDIDAKFGNFAHILGHRDALSMHDMIQVIKDTLLSESSKIETHILSRMYEIRNWLIPCLNELRRISESHCFLFLKDRPNHVTMKYKKWSKEKLWYPLPDMEVIELFKLDLLGNQIFPEGQPTLVEHNFARKDKFPEIEIKIK